MAPRVRRDRKASWQVMLAAILGVVLAAPPAGAQNIGRVAASLTGVVTDAQGGVLPGVLVTVAGPALQGTLTATTDGAGRYTVPSLPAGLYEVKAELSGFTTAVAPGVELKVGGALKVDLRMTVGGLETTVTVEAPVIDVVTAERTRNLAEREFAELPKGRSFESLVDLAPGVNTESLGQAPGLSFQGASVNENVFIIDGVDTTAPTSGVVGQNIVFEFLDNVQVKSGFVGADFGGALGGVVNLTTRSGSNAFRGFATYQFTGSSLTQSPRQRLRVNPVDSRRADYVQDAKDDETSADVGGALGGPIMRDRLWFFGGYLPQLVHTTRNVTFLLNGQTAAFENETRRHYLTSKLTWRMASRATLNVGYTGYPSANLGLLPSQDGTTNPNQDFAALGDERTNNSMSANADIVVSPRFLINAFVGLFGTDFTDLGTPNAKRLRFVTSNIGLAGVPTDLQRPANFETISNNIKTFKNATARANAGVVGTLNFDAAGGHTLKTGVQFATPELESASGYTGDRIDVHWNTSAFGVRGVYGYWRDWELARDGRATSTNLALFVQDSWAVRPRLTLNLGLRAEREEVKPYIAATDTTTRPIVFGFGDKLAPRLGVSWDARGDGSWKVFANGGLFYDTLKLSAPSASFGGGIFRITYYTLDTADWNALNHANPVGTQFFVQNLQGLPPVVEPDLRPTRTAEFSVGTEYQIARSLVGAVAYSRRRLSNAIENVILNAPPGSVTRFTAIANPGRGIAEFPYGRDFPVMPAFERSYDGIELVIDRRFSGRWSGSANYTWSRLHGNYEGLGDADEQAFGGGAINTNRYCDWLEGCYTATGEVDNGPLTLDRPHQFKMNGSFTLPGGLTLGGVFRATSGTIVTRQIGVNSASPVHPEGRGSDGRTDTLTQTNLLLTWRLPAMGTMRATATVNVLNLFDQDAVISRFPGMLLGTSTTIRVDPAQYFRGIDYAAGIAASGSALDPRFLLAQAFQPPRQVRVGLRLDF